MSKLRELFGPSRQEIWKQLADQLGGTFDKGKWFKGPSVRCQTGPWEIVLDTYDEHHGEHHSTYTRLRAPFLNKDSLRMKIFREGVLARMGKKLGMTDIQIGFLEFDREFIVQANDRDKICRLLQDEQIRKLIQESQGVTISIRDDEGFFHKTYPKGVDVLYASHSGVIRNLDELRMLYALFSAILDRLVAIDSAYERDPGFKL